MKFGVRKIAADDVDSRQGEDHVADGFEADEQDVFRRGHANACPCYTLPPVSAKKIPARQTARVNRVAAAYYARIYAGFSVQGLGVGQTLPCAAFYRCGDGRHQRSAVTAADRDGHVRLWRGVSHGEFSGDGKTADEGASVRAKLVW